MSLGFEAAGFEIAAAVEYDPVHCAAHKFNFPRTATICKSVVDVTGEEIRRKSNIGDADIGIVFGGAPCQGFSMIGKRALDDPRNSLVFHFVRIVSELKPKYFVFENVKGLTLGEHKRFLNEVIVAFGERGYDVLLPYQVLNAANFGVPQSRERLFLMGARRGLPLPAYPSPTGRVTVKQAIADLPDPESYPELWEQDCVHAKYGRPSAYAKILRAKIDDPNDFSYKRVFDPKMLTSSALTEHTPLSRLRFQNTLPGAVEPVSRFLKLDPNGISNTLRAGTASDRGAFTSPRPIHPIFPRVITVREAARIHSYPDWFRFNTTKWHGFRQIGNSVPPLLARAVGSSIMATLGARPVPPSTVLNLGDERLLSLPMTEASKLFGVPHDVISRKRVPLKSRTGSAPENRQQELAYA
jgi:DNA (cytosine-5)-methyltransferase 1